MHTLQCSFLQYFIRLYNDYDNFNAYKHFDHELDPYALWLHVGGLHPWWLHQYPSCELALLETL